MQDHGKVCYMHNCISAAPSNGGPWERSVRCKKIQLELFDLSIKIEGHSLKAIKKLECMVKPNGKLVTLQSPIVMFQANILTQNSK